MAAAFCERHALIEPKERLARRWLVFQNDLHVRDPSTQIRWQRVECVLRVLLEARSPIEQTGFHVQRVRAKPVRLSARASSGGGCRAGPVPPGPLARPS